MKIHKLPRSCGTHDGTFHADEVTACALLLLFNLIDANKIKRTRNPEILATCEYVCDVGGVYDPKQKLFDHHQTEYQGPFSSAGMVLLHLQTTGVITPKEYEAFNQALIGGVDAHDNGKDPQIPGLCTYSHIIAGFTPIHHDEDPKDQDLAFESALKFAYDHLHRFWSRLQYIRSCRQLVEEKMSELKDYLVFDKNIPWLDSFFELGGQKHPAQFVIMPSGKHWKLRGIPPDNQHRMQVRTPLPEEWAGLLEEPLREICGIAGAIFCHKGRFISVWATKEDAVEALQLVLKKTGQWK